ncbi:hypothetical protein K0M31_003449, partial [Melipona bicolor]
MGKLIQQREGISNSTLSRPDPNQRESRLGRQIADVERKQGIKETTSPGLVEDRPWTQRSSCYQVIPCKRSLPFPMGQTHKAAEGRPTDTMDHGDKDICIVFCTVYRYTGSDPA